MGLEPPFLPRGLSPQKGDPSDFVIVRGSESLAQAVLNPSYDRTTIRQSRVVAQRRTTTWMISEDLPWYRRIKWLYFIFSPLSYSLTRYANLEIVPRLIQNYNSIPSDSDSVYINQRKTRNVQG